LLKIQEGFKGSLAEQGQKPRIRLKQVFPHS
jgi:hypothetical protein